jgi:hypothetical protein
VGIDGEEWQAEIVESCTAPLMDIVVHMYFCKAEDLVDNFSETSGSEADKEE